MHLQEVISAIHANHIYEYVVLDRHFCIVECSDEAYRFCDKKPENDKIVFEYLPELHGLENVMADIMDAKKEAFNLPHIYKPSGEYINIYLHPGKRSKANPKRYDTLVVLLEVVTPEAKAYQALVQERNEKSLVLYELEEKNNELNRLNREMERRIAEATQRVMEKNRMVELKSRHSEMGEMISMITHQWKQPISAALMLVHIIKTKIQKDTIDKEDLLKKLDQVYQLVDHMNEIIKSFQGFFNPIKQRVIFNLYNSIEKIVNIIKYDYTVNDIEISIEGDRFIEISGYPNEFNQAVLSLLKNAKDAFMANPHDHMKITITIESEDDEVVVRIADNAGGIPESILDTLFEPYVTTKKDGSGIGLSIARTIIEESMKGSISARNIENGAEFEIRLKRNSGEELSAERPDLLV